MHHCRRHHHHHNPPALRSKHPPPKRICPLLSPDLLTLLRKPSVVFQLASRSLYAVAAYAASSFRWTEAVGASHVTFSVSSW